jgi:hypothetical protein
MLGKDACALLVEFFDAVPPKRLPAFIDAPEVAESGRRRFEFELAK